MINVFMVTLSRRRHSLAIGSCCGRGSVLKLHHPWKGPFRILKKISICDYVVESTAGKHIRTILHFNRLKLCKPGMRFQHILNDDGESSLNADPAIGQQPKAASHLATWRTSGTGGH